MRLELHLLGGFSVVDDKLDDVYDTRDEAIVREHARRGGFPVSRIAAIVTVLDPMNGGSDE
jgi:hypothetical protein